MGFMNELFIFFYLKDLVGKKVLLSYRLCFLVD